MICIIKRINENISLTFSTKINFYIGRGKIVSITFQ